MRKSMIVFILSILTIGISVTGCQRDEGVETLPPDNIVQIDIPETEITEITLYHYNYNGIDALISDDNDICNLISSKTNCMIKEVDYSEAISDREELLAMVDNDNLTDLIYCSDYESIGASSKTTFLGENGMLIPWDYYLDKYPNLKELYTDEEWDLFRQEDGHIYWVDLLGKTYGEDRSTSHDEFAFWIQARVLEWDGYPEINTLDEYFDLLERYTDANPTMPDGTDVIPYTALCDDWRYYCIESAPSYLDGYYGLGSISVNEDDPNNPYVIDYNVTPTAKLYYQKLNEVYNAGYMDKDFDTQTYDEYMEKLSTGRVLGMTDQYWDFAYMIDTAFDENGLKEIGCDYVPLAIVMNEGQSSQYHLYTDDYIDVYGGLAVTTKCSNPEVVFKFLNDLLDQEIHNLRFWGIEGEDYCVDEKGLFYRTEEMRDKWSDPEYRMKHVCQYPFMPNWYGTSKDGINAMRPEQQTSEFYATLSSPLARCFEAYGASGYADMLKSDKDYRQGVWYPLYEYSSSANETPADIASKAIVNCKHEWIPNVVKSTDFELSWNQYMEAYNDCNPQDFLDYQQKLIDERLGK